MPRDSGDDAEDDTNYFQQQYCCTATKKWTIIARYHLATNIIMERSSYIRKNEIQIYTSSVRSTKKYSLIKTQLCKLRVILRSRVLRSVCPREGYRSVTPVYHTREFTMLFLFCTCRRAPHQQHRISDASLTLLAWASSCGP